MEPGAKADAPADGPLSAGPLMTDTGFEGPARHTHWQAASATSGPIT